MISNGGWSLAEGCPNREGCSKQMLKKAPRCPQATLLQTARGSLHRLRRSLLPRPGFGVAGTRLEAHSESWPYDPPYGEPGRRSLPRLDDGIALVLQM
jgi:hypothetical protein